MFRFFFVCFVLVFLRRFPSCSMEGRQLRGCEELNCPSSYFVSIEEKMEECLNKTDNVMEEKKNYAEATRESAKT